MVVGRGGRETPGALLVGRWKGEAKNPIELGVLDQRLRLGEEGNSVTRKITISSRFARAGKFLRLVDQDRRERVVGNLLDTSRKALIGLEIRRWVFKEGWTVTRAIGENKGPEARREKNYEVCSLEHRVG